MSRPGVTKTEIAVVLSIVVILIAIIVPVMQSARDDARRSSCKNNLKQLGLALSTYHDAFKGFPPGCAGPHALPVEKQWSYSPFLSTYLSNVGGVQADLSLSWDDPAQRPYRSPVSAGILYVDPTWRCPSDPRTDLYYGQPHTSYVGVLGIAPEAGFLKRDNPRAGAWAYESQTTLDDITDGKAETIMLCESMSHTGCWLACGSATLREIDPQDMPYLSVSDYSRPYGSAHVGGAQALQADGSVRFISEIIYPPVFEALCTIGDEEIYME